MIFSYELLLGLTVAAELSAKFSVLLFLGWLRLLGFGSTRFGTRSA